MGGDGTRKSRHLCCALYVVRVCFVGGMAEMECLSQKAVRDTPNLSSSAQPRVESKLVSGLQSTAAIGQPGLRASSNL